MYTNIHIYIPARRYQALKLYDLNRSGNGGDDYNDGSSTPKTIAIEMDKKKKQPVWCYIFVDIECRLLLI